MCAIAERAGAPIGSLYQFFPNKAAITHALRTKFGSDYEDLLIKMEEEASSLSLRAARRASDENDCSLCGGSPGISCTARCAREHRERPASLRNTLRMRLARCLIAVRTRAPEDEGPASCDSLTANDQGIEPTVRRSFTN